jgi:photosystem II stability/assembly factor-like uncharacterized protein
MTKNSRALSFLFALLAAAATLAQAPAPQPPATPTPPPPSKDESSEDPKPGKSEPAAEVKAEELEAKEAKAKEEKEKEEKARQEKAGTAKAEKAAKKKGAEEEKKTDPREELYSGLAFRSIGPAITSGRIVDLAVDPTDSTRFFVAAAAGGVWRTENAGVTFTPVFDGAGTSATGAVAIAPSDPMQVWVGTGENNMQRVSAYGDGVYKSIDGGKTFENVGLKRTEHIGKILIDPRDANVVWVAAQGPLWSAGGERGLYKSVDGGKSWSQVLKISDYTGVTDIVFDPRDPDVVYAAAWQRERKVYAMVSGGPESALYKTTDGGKSFRKLTKGLPKVELGRIGLAVSPIDPDVVYLILEAADGESGFFRSTDRGESWSKQSKHSTSGNYYSEIFADPHKFDRVWSVDVFLQVSDDGGKTFREAGETNKHVDNHAVWIDPENRDHLLVGCDGGLYESFDGAATWRFFTNLPLTQFYKVEVDDSEPFYRVYGGTQDNFTLGGPSRTLSANGILSQDWEMLTGGDGFQPRVEPGNPDIAYALVQYGVLIRVDRKTHEETYVAPLPEPGEPPLRWNWDSPLVISPYSPQRLYFAAQKVFVSDNRGDDWRAISGDLTRQLDRNQLPILGKIAKADSVAKNQSTSPYGNIVALAESRLEEGYLVVGTDDGLIQISENAGATWRKLEQFPGIPERAYVRRAEPSRHQKDTIYAAFDNHKMGDFKPYLLKSPDRGRSWSAITKGLPERGNIYAFYEDPVDPELLFVGTEFGLHVSQDGGKSWFALKGGLPTAQVRDVTVQARENDLVIATFGRGFYVLDDMTPLRRLNSDAAKRRLDSEATLFPVRPALAYVPFQQLGYRGKGFQGENLYAAENPPFGAVFTLHLKSELMTLKKARQEREKELEKANKTPPYPSHDDFRAEAAEEAPKQFLVVRDADGEVVRRLDAPTAKGLHRVAWDLRYPAPNPAKLEPPRIVNAYSFIPQGPMAAPGRFTVSLERRQHGQTRVIAGPEPFEVKTVAATSLTAPDRVALEKFLTDASALRRAALGASALVSEALERIAFAKRALDDSEANDSALADEARAIEKKLKALEITLDGDAAIARRQEPTPPALTDRANYIADVHWSSTSAPTGTAKRQYELASAELAKVLAELKPLVENDLAGLEKKLDSVGAPWTPGRVPVWPQK